MGVFDRLFPRDGMSNLTPAERAAVEADGGELAHMVRHFGQPPLSQTVIAPFEVGIETPHEEQQQ